MEANEGTGRFKVLVVDDHPIVRRGLIEMLEEQPDLVVCGEAKDRVEALRVEQQTQPDLVLLDICLPGESGLVLLKELNGRAKVLVISMHDETLYAERALSAGAAGYIAKHEPVERLVEAIRSVLNGKLYVSDSLTERLLNRFVGGGRHELRDDIARLTGRELEVFRMLGKGMSTREIAEVLHVSRKTVDTHRENLKRKLNLKSGSELVVKATAWMFDPATRAGHAAPEP